MVFGSNFTLSRHTLFPLAAVRPRYGNANNMCARGFKWLSHLNRQAWGERVVYKPAGCSFVNGADALFMGAAGTVLGAVQRSFIKRRMGVIRHKTKILSYYFI